MNQSNFQYKNIKVDNIDFTANPEFNSKSETIDMKNSFSIKVKPDKTGTFALVSLTFTTNAKDFTSSQIPFYLQITISAVFSWHDLPDKKVENLLKYNAPALLISYLRPIVASITNMSGFPSYNIPLLNLVD